MGFGATELVFGVTNPGFGGFSCLCWVSNSSRGTTQPGWRYNLMKIQTQAVSAWLLAMLVLIAPLQAQDALPPIDGLLPDSGGSGIPTVTIPAAEPGSALEAMLALGEKYSGGILEVTGRSGSPAPREWVILARNPDSNGKLHQFKVAGGQIVADVMSLNPAETFRSSGDFISLASMQVDSGAAYMIAQKKAAACGASLGSVDYSLSARGKSVGPVWTLQCADSNGRPLGKIEILARSGDVIASSGFK